MKQPDSARTEAISVRNEFAPLREVVVGANDPDGLVMPLSYSAVKYIRLSPEEVEFLDRNAGRPVLDVYPPEEVHAVTRELDDLAALFEADGVRVHRPRPFTDAESRYVVPGGAPVFARDPIIVVGSAVIEASLMIPGRRKEAFAFRDALAARLAEDSEACWIAAPPPLPSEFDIERPDGPGPFLEGGDVFLLDDDILVGDSGLASNRAGVDWLRRHAGGRRVHQVQLADTWLHLDCVLAVVRPGLAIAHRPAFTGGLPDLIADWEVIDATEEEARAMGCNTLCLAPNRVIVPSEHTRLIGELRRRGVEVVDDISFAKVSQNGGGVRCATAPLVRG
ncbi:N-dimethylarginine dimethylaminohydrolase [Nocardiopsis mwathae]|uniref:N-dimethylarginine dimethylaminohydrolase n=1 Tax=Nocardiopsis mwathae TaxID=1472723 RepID=A0A7W9YJL8_9ACTN|nr:arginine deiminase family protein [Nocardiopsis mwathae]MBB6173382.1 N-dimethylarginine dimethylaminohydrolase [Nocardiopsis mwathae]